MPVAQGSTVEKESTYIPMDGATELFLPRTLTCNQREFVNKYEYHLQFKFKRSFFFLIYRLIKSGLKWQNL